MLTSKKVINAINEPACAKASAWQGLHPRLPRRSCWTKVGNPR